MCAKAVSAFLLFGFCLLTRPAQADVTYVFTGTIQNPDIGTNPFTRQLVFTDAAVAAGRIDFDYQSFYCGGSPVPCQASGDSSGFVTLSYATADPASDQVTGNLRMDLVFNSDRTLSGDLFSSGFFEDLTLQGSEFGWTGAQQADGPTSCPSISAPNACTVSGYWLTSQALPTQVPEPPAALLLVGGIAVLSLLGRGGRRPRPPRMPGRRG